MSYKVGDKLYTVAEADEPYIREHEVVRVGKTYELFPSFLARGSSRSERLLEEDLHQLHHTPHEAWEAYTTSFARRVESLRAKLDRAVADLTRISCLDRPRVYTVEMHLQRVEDAKRKMEQLSQSGRLEL